MPAGTKLTAFHSGAGAGDAAAWQRIVHAVETGVYRVHLDRVFPLEDVGAAHRYLESDAATGKVVLSVAGTPGQRGDSCGCHQGSVTSR
ncbi:hypothetical protein GCM10009539_34250 [Cryptosporangium japonicum]|uniref:Uncharacterized protein n=1 Tax=Cryptosporangium japonicum TaxID=80872 RepID=A0ABN0UCP5_9ACTN